MKDEIEVVQKEEDGQVKDENVGNSTETVSQDMELGVYNVNEKVLHGNVPDVTGAIATDVATEVCNEKELSSNSDLDRNLGTTLQGEDVQEKSLTSSSENARDAPNKRLSASAAPFNPSPATVRGPLMPLNIAIPPGPAISPWQMNMTFHPGPTAILPPGSPMCSSPLHPYPSPPRIANVMHPIPYMFPPYSPTQAVPPSSFPMTTGPFHTNHIAWHNMDSTAVEFVPGAVWHSCHPVESSVLPPVVEPISDPISEAPLQSDHMEGTSPVSTLPVEAKNEEETKELDSPALDMINIDTTTAEIGMENEKEKDEVI